MLHRLTPVEYLITVHIKYKLSGILSFTHSTCSTSPTNFVWPRRLGIGNYQYIPWFHRRPHCFCSLFSYCGSICGIGNIFFYCACFLVQCIQIVLNPASFWGKHRIWTFRSDGYLLKEALAGNICRNGPFLKYAAFSERCMFRFHSTVGIHPETICMSCWGMSHEVCHMLSPPCGLFGKSAG